MTTRDALSDPPLATGFESTDLIRSEQVAALYRNGPLGIVSTLVALCILVGVLMRLGGLSAAIAIAFIGAVVINTALRTLLVRAYFRAAPPVAAWRPWAWRMGLSVFMAGLTIGVGACFLMVPERVDLALLVAITVTGIASGVVVAWGSFLPVFFVSFYALLLPPTLWTMAQGGLLHLALASLMLIYMAIGTLLARNYNRGVIESLRLRFENLALVADLRRQKERAEQASRDKSRFLAAASHDLRQPVHALGMFVGALRREAVGTVAQQLIEHIDGSVQAMDELFTSLLDISRLDAGVIESTPLLFDIEPLLKRVARDLGEEAHDKGLRFSLRGRAALVRSDPVLLERVLRNLVSNAVRYTDRGGVVLAARRRGAELSIEVWDSGRGIAAEHQDNVFQEFFQVDNPERDRGKGLGLGLAIVRRLTALLEARLSLRSVPGRGSVFKVLLPWVAGNEASGASGVEASPAKALAGGRRACIVVVDDEVAVRVAMHSLLSSWGHQVIVGASAAEIVADGSVGGLIPDLIISDYRLRGADTGVEVISALRAHFAAPVPAMLVTGDTAPDRLREAQASGFLLLHKPVSNGRLRAAVGNLIARRDAASDG